MTPCGNDVKATAGDQTPTAHSRESSSEASRELSRPLPLPPQGKCSAPAIFPFPAVARRAVGSQPGNGARSPYRRHLATAAPGTDSAAGPRAGSPIHPAPSSAGFPRGTLRTLSLLLLAAPGVWAALACSLRFGGSRRPWCRLGEGACGTCPTSLLLSELLGVAEAWREAEALVLVPG